MQWKVGVFGSAQISIMKVYYPMTLALRRGIQCPEKKRYVTLDLPLAVECITIVG